MKNSFLLLVLSVLLTNCVAIRHTEFHRTEPFNPQASFKIVAADSNDPTLSMLELQMIQQGFKVISDNQMRAFVPSGMVMVSSMDTTYSYSSTRPVNFQLFKDQPADYVIRYSSSFNGLGRGFLRFNASVVNVRTGQVEFTYSFHQGYLGWFKKKARLVLRDFAKKMNNR